MTYETLEELQKALEKEFISHYKRNLLCQYKSKKYIEMWRHSGESKHLQKAANNLIKLMKMNKRNKKGVYCRINKIFEFLPLDHREYKLKFDTPEEYENIQKTINSMVDKDEKLAKN